MQLHNREIITTKRSAQTHGVFMLRGAFHGQQAFGTLILNLNAKQSYKLSPVVGGGIDYNIRPWVRIGGEYIYSRYRREQRFSTLDTKVVPIKAYGNYMMNYHNAKLNVGFNFMEIWSNRKAQWFNIYISTTQTQNGTTVPVGGSISIDNSQLV